MTKTGSSQNPKSVAITALITAVSTILVSLIAIVPQLANARDKGRSDQDQVQAMQQRVREMDEELADLRKKIPHSEREWALSGTVGQKESMQQPMKAVDIYLLPSGERGKHLVTQTDDMGKFSLKVPPGQYSIVLRDALGNWSYKGLIPDPTRHGSAEELRNLDDEFKASRAYIKYRIASTSN